MARLEAVISARAPTQAWGGMVRSAMTLAEALAKDVARALTAAWGGE